MAGAERNSERALPAPSSMIPNPVIARNSRPPDRKSTRLNSSHSQISYAVFCLKKKKHKPTNTQSPQANPPGTQRTTAYTYMEQIPPHSKTQHTLSTSCTLLSFSDSDPQNSNSV